MSQYLNMNEVTALVLGGGKGTRLFPLTKERAKPAVPLAGEFRLIDIPLSNCINSQIQRIFVITQFLSHSLHKHVHDSYKFDIFGNKCIDILAASQGVHGDNWFQGTADAVRQSLKVCYDATNYTEKTLILSGDQIYRMDFKGVCSEHNKNNADLTIAVTIKPAKEAHGLGCMLVDENLKIIKFVEKPKGDAINELILPQEFLDKYNIKVNEPSVLVSMGIYLFETKELFRCLDNDLEDFGKNIIPKVIQESSVYAHLFEGYWEDIGTIKAFYDANLALTDTVPPFDFYDEKKPIYSAATFLPCAKVNGNSVFAKALISSGAIIENSTITRCIIGVRSVIHDNCVLNNVIMMGQDDYRIDETGYAKGIGKGCNITRAIIDKNAHIGNNVIIQSQEGKPDYDGDFYYIRDGITIIPKNAIVPDNTIIS